MSQSKQDKSKALVLEAFDTLFKRDYVGAALLVPALHSTTQRSYRAGPRRSVQSHQEYPANVEVRTRNDRGRGRLCDCAREI